MRIDGSVYDERCEVREKPEGELMFTTGLKKRRRIADGLRELAQ